MGGCAPLLSSSPCQATRSCSSLQGLSLSHLFAQGRFLCFPIFVRPSQTFPLDEPTLTFPFSNSFSPAFSTFSSPVVDSFYYAQVSVGSPKQNFNIILDTGSSDFWVADSECTNSQCAAVETFNSQQSSSFTSSTTEFQIQYGSGAVQGTLAADTVSLAGYAIDDLTFAEVDQLADNTLSPPASGIMGMGFQSLASR